MYTVETRKYLSMVITAQDMDDVLKRDCSNEKRASRLFEKFQVEGRLTSQCHAGNLSLMFISMLKLNE